jgi:hypothetical protein
MGVGGGSGSWDRVAPSAMIFGDEYGISVATKGLGTYRVSHTAVLLVKNWTTYRYT